MILILDPMDATDASALKVEVLALKDCVQRLSIRTRGRLRNTITMNKHNILFFYILIDN